MYMVEILANKLGIFIKHDLVPFEQPHLPVRVCLLLNLSKPIPFEITICSKYGAWIQPVVIQDSITIHSCAPLLGHFTSQCCGDSDAPLQVCLDFSSDFLQCSFFKSKDHQSLKDHNVKDSSPLPLSVTSLVPFSGYTVCDVPLMDFTFLCSLVMFFFVMSAICQFCSVS